MDTQKLWKIHGKYYDFSSFTHEHPGGVEMLMLGRGRDCTELFESVHALGSPKPFELLRKYEVREKHVSGKDSSDSSSDDEKIAGEARMQKNVNTPAASTPATAGADEVFVWDRDNGFYGVLTKRVKDFVKKEPSMKGNYKATWKVYTKNISMLVFYMITLYVALFTPSLNVLLRTAVAASCGLVAAMFLFCSMHDGLHGAISKKYPILNMISGEVVHWFFWDSWIWMRHHTYAHHSYTGLYRKDPDLTNSKVFLRKHHESSYKPLYKTQHIHAWFWMMLLPNQFLGQALVYALSYIKSKVFGVPLEPKPWNYSKWVLYPLSFLTHLVLPLFYISLSTMLWTNFVIWTCIGISYFMVVLPNHDTDDVMNTIIKPTSEKKVDWGELQVRNSSNHSLDSSLLSQFITYAYGGMNFQIEHHLFPSVCHEHYPKIAPIVQQTCKEFNIPYNQKDNMWECIKGYYNVLKAMGKNYKKQ